MNFARFRMWNDEKTSNSNEIYDFSKKMQKEGISKSIQGGLFDLSTLSIYSILHSGDMRDNSMVSI